MKFRVTNELRGNYISLVLLNEIINFQTYFPAFPSHETILIKNYLVGMECKGMLRVEAGRFVPTELGRNELVKLFNKYSEYLKMFDIYCAVDLEKGEFAFSSINDDVSDDQWYAFLNEERFSDVRVAVSEFKGINPIEIVFLTFLHEGKFDCTVEGWQDTLVGDTIWAEIEAICNSAVSLEYLTSEGVIEEIVKQGTEIALDLIKLAENSEQCSEEITEEVVEETTTVEEYVDVVEMPVYGYSYYEPYYDPYYISPLWLVPAILLF